MDNAKEKNICDDCGDEKRESVVLNKKNFTIASGVLLGLAFLLGFTAVDQKIVTFVYLLSMLSGGSFVYLSAIRGLFKQRFLNINFLVSVAALGALYIGQYAEAASVVFFFSLAEAFEEYGIEKSRRALEALIERAPKMATRKDGTVIPVTDVQIGEVVIVRAGDTIPLDGRVVEGFSSIDEATITGESVPKDKLAGDIVYAGTQNQNGYLEIRVEKDGTNSTLSKIVALVDQAQRSRAPIHDFMDTFARYYTPLVVLIATGLAIIPPLFGMDGFMDSLYRALTLLVIACPCALVIASPIAIASAVGGASKRGVLIRGGKYLQALANTSVVAFDKTGTLTEGKPRITDVIPLGNHTETQLLADASGIALLSTHPLSVAIAEYGTQKGITPHAMREYQNLSGRGSEARCIVCNDTEHCIGNAKLLEEKSIVIDVLRERAEELEGEGKTLVLVTEGKEVVGIIAIADAPRINASSTIDLLTKRGVTTVMLTGDNIRTAQAAGRELGVSLVYASLLPEEKVSRIQEFQKTRGQVVMVGDGINDAPALAAANVGMAMGAKGSDVAIETADVALLNDNIEMIPYAISLGKKTMAAIRFNIVISLLVKVVFLFIAVFGTPHLAWAIASDSGIALIVVANSLRLFRVS